MTQVNVSLPDDLSEWAKARAAETRPGRPGDYLAELVRRDRDEAEKLARLQAAIDDRRASPISSRTIEDVITDGRRRQPAR